MAYANLCRASAALLLLCSASLASAGIDQDAAATLPVAEPAEDASPEAPAALPEAELEEDTEAGPMATLPAFTPVFVMMNDDVSTELSKVGDRFGVTVLHDVLDGPTVAIPKGTTGEGEVTFVTGNGGFGKAGIIAISLRHLDLEGKEVSLDGRYREEGRNKNGATAATWFAVGVFSGFIRGKDGYIPKGRELKARTGEDILYSLAGGFNAPEGEAEQPDAAQAGEAAEIIDQSDDTETSSSIAP